MVRRCLFRTMIPDRKRLGGFGYDGANGAFGSGTYKVEGNKIVTHYDTSWHQIWTGRDISSQTEIKGKTLTLTTDPFKSPFDGKEVVSVTTWERVE